MIQTSAVFFLGIAGATLVQGVWQFVAQVVLMTVFAAVLYGWLLSGKYGNLQFLIGIVLGGGLRALSTFMQRLLPPTEFDVLTARLIGSIANADASYLAVSIPITAIAGGMLWAGGRLLNVLALGREAALDLGVNHRRETITATCSPWPGSPASSSWAAPASSSRTSSTRPAPSASSSRASVARSSSSTS